VRSLPSAFAIASRSDVLPEAFSLTRKTEPPSSFREKVLKLRKLATSIESTTMLVSPNMRQLRMVRVIPLLSGKGARANIQDYPRFASNSLIYSTSRFTPSIGMAS
jgi:hypothetical protein